LEKEMTIIHDLIALYNSLSPDKIYHRTIAIILKNIHQIPNLSLEETAELCNTSIITINRLLKQINCPSFRTFKQRIAETLNSYVIHNRVFPYDAQASDFSVSGQITVHNYFSFLQSHIQDLEQRIDIEQINKAVDILHAASNIHVYGLYAASHAKQQLQVDLMVSGKEVVCYCDSADEEKDTKNLDAQSAIIAQVIASYKNYATHLPIIKKILHSQTPSIIITSTKTPVNFKEADCILTFKGTDTAMDNYFVDMIFNLLCITHRNKYLD
jgi:DNA-binding MurR/RpiR family transcriptional regulator